MFTILADYGSLVASGTESASGGTGVEQYVIVVRVSSLNSKKLPTATNEGVICAILFVLVQAGGELGW